MQTMIAIQGTQRGGGAAGIGDQAMDDQHLLDGTRKTPAKLSSLWHRIATMRERAFGRRMLAFSIACTTQSAQRSGP